MLFCNFIFTQISFELLWYSYTKSNLYLFVTVIKTPPVPFTCRGFTISMKYWVLTSVNDFMIHDCIIQSRFNDTHNVWNIHWWILLVHGNRHCENNVNSLGVLPTVSNNSLLSSTCLRSEPTQICIYFLSLFDSWNFKTKLVFYWISVSHLIFRIFKLSHWRNCYFLNYDTNSRFSPLIFVLFENNHLFSLNTLQNHKICWIKIYKM